MILPVRDMIRRYTPVQNRMPGLYDKDLYRYAHDIAIYRMQQDAGMCD